MGTHSPPGGGDPELGHLADSLPGVVFTYQLSPDGQDGFRFLSARISDWLGISTEDAMRDPRRIWDHIHPEDRDHLLNARAETTTEGGSFAAEFRVIGAAGRERWLSVTSTPEAPSPDGTLVFHGMALDITEARRSRMRKEAQRQLLERVAKGAPLPEVLDDVCRLVESQLADAKATILLLDHETRTVRFGAAPTIDRGYMQALEGLEIGPEAGTCGTALYFGSQVVSADLSRDPKWAPYIELARQYDLASCWSTPFFAHNGQPAGTLAVYRSNPGHPSSVALELSSTAAYLAGIAFQREETQHHLQETEAQLHHAQKMEALGQLAGGIAHDFNNILTVIHGASAMLLDSLPESSPERQDALLITTSAERAAELTRQLLAFGRRQAWSPKAVEVSAVIKSLETILSRTLGDTVRLVLDIDEDLPLVWIDPTQLEQVLVNLVMNARDAMPRGGQVTLRARRSLVAAGPETAEIHTEGVCLEVQDDGEGMSPEVLQHIFEPFFTTKPRGQGTGLGLPMVYAVVGRAGGTVVAESEPGKGTCFTVCLPAHNVASALPGHAMPRSGTGPRKSTRARPGERLLLVEDEPLVRALAARVLRGRGYEVTEAEDGKVALEVLQATDGHFNLILSDVMMPNLRGTELAEEARRRYPELPVLLMSAYTDDLLLLQDSLRFGHRLLSKPFTPATLARRVRDAIDGVEELETQTLSIDLQP
ncbi:MAG: response regulator [Deltaproteobacteria bacterium]|nr:response regulator [Deltaproteobacteria bacterium]